MDAQELAMTVAKLRKDIRHAERSNEKWREIEAKADRHITQGGYAIVIGLLLTPVGIGLFLILIGFLTRFSNFGKRNKARKGIETNRFRIDVLEDKLAKLEGQMFAMQAGVQLQQA